MLHRLSRLRGCHIHAIDGEIGHVDDVLVDERTLAVQYLVVDTSNWIGGRSVIVSPDTVEGIDKERGQLFVAADREAIKQAPAFESIQSALDLTETGPPFTII